MNEKGYLSKEKKPCTNIITYIYSKSLKRYKYNFGVMPPYNTNVFPGMTFLSSLNI